MLNLSKYYMDRLEKIYTIIKEIVQDVDIYVFGGYAKRKIKQSSDIDILVILNTEIEKNKIKQLKWCIEEKIEDLINFEYEVDLKVYSREHFEKSKENIGFESHIATYMVKLEDSLWK